MSNMYPKKPIKSDIIDKYPQGILYTRKREN
jgi:hypothetical protein